MYPRTSQPVRVSSPHLDERVRVADGAPVVCHQVRDLVLRHLHLGKSRRRHKKPAWNDRVSVRIMHLAHTNACANTGRRGHIKIKSTLRWIEILASVINISSNARYYR